jgi:hypothetical protein
MRWLRPLVAVSLLTSPLALAGCKQGLNDRCQVQSDCDDGLLCVLPAGGTPQAGGTCQMPGGGVDMTAPSQPDLSGTPTPDLSSTD